MKLNKFIFTLPIMLFVTQVVALPPTSIERVYYATSAKEIIVGEYVIGCSTANYHSGEVTPFWENDPVTINCSAMGNKVGDFENCFTDPENDFEWDDLDFDGKIDGYKKLHGCVNTIFLSVL